MRSQGRSRLRRLAGIIGFLIFLLAGTSLMLAGVPEQAEADSYPIVSYDANGGIAKPTSPPAQQEMTSASTTFNGGDHNVGVDFGDDFTPPENYRFVGIEVTDQKTGTTTYFDHTQLYNFTVTNDTVIKYIWQTYTVRFHFSAIDGNNLAEPIVLYSNNPLTLVSDLIRQYYGDNATMNDVTFSLDGYIDSGLRTWYPINDYANFSEATADLFNPEVWIGDTGADIYVLMLKEIKDVSIDIEAPVCGTKTETQEDGSGWLWDTQTNPPDITTPASAPYGLGTTSTYLSRYWIADMIDGDPFVGTIAGDEDFIAWAWLEAAYGYGFGDNVTANVSGGKFEKTLNADTDWLAVVASVKPKHVAGDAAEENRVEPKCFEDGSYDMVTHCTGCDTILGSEHFSIDKIGLHDWGEWKVTTEATTQAEGIETRICSRCGAEETRAISKKETDATEKAAEKVDTLVSTGDTAPVAALGLIAIAAAMLAGIAGHRGLRRQ